MTDFDCDVLIAGGGPTGVTLAVLLARRGVKVIVAEKEADIYPLPRAAHIDHECLRILQEAGIVDEVMSGSRRASRYDFLNAKGDVLLRFRGSEQIGPVWLSTVWCGTCLNWPPAPSVCARWAACRCRACAARPGSPMCRCRFRACRCSQGTGCTQTKTVWWWPATR